MGSPVKGSDTVTISAEPVVYNKIDEKQRKGIVLRGNYVEIFWEPGNVLGFAQRIWISALSPLWVCVLVFCMIESNNPDEESIKHVNQKKQENQILCV